MAEKTQRMFGAQHCPAQHELNSIGYVLKWPATAVFHNKGPLTWEIRSPAEQPFYKFHSHSSFPEAGQSDAISIGLGWIVVTPPGWSVLIKNLPNNLSGWKHGINFAEGIIRADQATIPMQVHAYLPPIKIRRGEPMALLLPFRREASAIAVVDDRAAVEEAARIGEENARLFGEKPGGYRRMYLENEKPSEMYPKLMEAWRKKNEG